ncbi:MAG TPA: hypothetical protein VKU36_05120 [Candidatus Babeliales bacterium]|nr:hypothetical protein [Candidatus Babeliales bacterium]
MRLMRASKIIFGALITFCIAKSQQDLITHTVTDLDPSTKEIAIYFVIPKKDFIYKDFIAFSIDNPHIILSAWKADKQSVAHYSSSFKEAKHIFNEDVTIFLTATNKAPELCNTNLYCTYYRKSEKKINHLLFPLTFSALPTHAQEPCIVHEPLEFHTATLKPLKKESSLHGYVDTATNIINMVISSVKIDHKKYFAFVLFIILILFSFFYFFKDELNIHIMLKEWIEISISLLLCLSASYLLFYFHTFTTPLTTMLLAILTVLYAGIFYIKKSTKVQSKNLRTLCTFMGMLCMSSILLLAFKAVQYADQQFGLL